ncbi:MAG: hypothetical protein WCJ33_09785, partial [Pseudomonadota bacterium]
ILILYLQTFALFKSLMRLFFMDRIKKISEFLLAAPKDNFLRHALALEYIKIGNDIKARQIFEEILQDDEIYSGSYYHLGKLLERCGDMEAAITCYKKGMDVCLQQKEQHAYNELRGAYEELVF